jgi:hypothetical protein
MLILAILALSIGAAACSAETSSTADEPAGDDSAATKWVKVATMKGSASKTSPSFKLQGGEQKLTYTIRGGEMVVAAVYVEEAGWDLNEDGGIPVVMPDKAGTDSTMMSRDAGKYVVHVEAANCDWVVTIKEKQ